MRLTDHPAISGIDEMVAYDKLRQQNNEKKKQKIKEDDNIILMEENTDKRILDFTIGELIMNTHTTIIDIATLFINKNLTLNELSKNNRMFYIGIIFIIIFIMYLLLDKLNTVHTH